MVNFRRFYTFLSCRLYKVYPALNAQYDDETGETLLVPAITQSNQAINQLIATIVTLVIALVGGALTGKGLQKYEGYCI